MSAKHCLWTTWFHLLLATSLIAQPESRSIALLLRDLTSRTSDSRLKAIEDLKQRTGELLPYADRLALSLADHEPAVRIGSASLLWEVIKSSDPLLKQKYLPGIAGTLGEIVSSSAEDSWDAFEVLKSIVDNRRDAIFSIALDPAFKLTLASRLGIAKVLIASTENDASADDNSDDDDADSGKTIVAQSEKKGQDKKRSSLRLLVGTLVEGLHAKNTALQADAAESLASIGSDAIAALPDLELALRGADMPVRIKAAKALWKVDWRGKETINVLLDALVHPRNSVQMQLATDAIRWMAIDVANVVYEDPTLSHHPHSNAVRDLRGAINSKLVTDLVTLFRHTPPQSPESKACVDAFTIVGPHAAGAVPILIEQLKSHVDTNGSPQSTLGYIGEPAIPSLMGILRDKAQSAVVKEDAASAVRMIGPPAKAAIPYLLPGLKGSFYGAQKYAEALGKIGAPSVPYLVTTLLQSKDRDVKEQACRALQLIGSDARASVPALLHTLKSRDDSLRGAAVDALGAVSAGYAPVLPDLIRLLDDPDWGVRRSAAYSIGDMGPAASSAVPSLIHLLRTQRGFDVDAARTALGRIGPAARGAVPFLILQLRLAGDVEYAFPEDQQDEILKVISAVGPPSLDSLQSLVAIVQLEEGLPKERAVHAIGQLGPSAAPALETLRIALGTARDKHLKEELVVALGQIGSASTAGPVLLAALDDPDVQAESGAILTRYGSSAVSVLREGLRSNSVAIRGAAIDTVARIGPSAKDAYPDLITDLNFPDSRVAASYALGSIAPAFDGRGILDPGIERQLSGALRQEESVAVSLAGAQRSNFVSNAMEPLRGALRSSENAKNANATRRLLLATSGVAALLIIVLSILLSVRIRRLVLVNLGRRWSLVPGFCQYDGSINIIGEQVHVQIRNLADAQSTAYSETLPSGLQWQQTTERLSQIQRNLRPGGTVVLTVADKLFDRPWAHLVGTPWSDGAKAIVAGQVCGTTHWAAVPVPRNRNISFAALGCENPRDGDLLYAARDEIEAVTDQFRTWRADVHIPLLDANSAEFREALLTADIVHFTGHAAPTGLCLADGFMDIRQLDQDLLRRIRCRLLVLSACEAGRLIEQSFAYRLVEVGVTIIAALQPVRDHACRTFFSEFYKGLLPSKHMAGVEIASALRNASESCSQRFRKAATLLGRSEGLDGWEQTLNSFILYGDPSSQLKLSANSRGGVA